MERPDHILVDDDCEIRDMVARHLQKNGRVLARDGALGTRRRRTNAPPTRETDSHDSTPYLKATGLFDRSRDGPSLFPTFSIARSSIEPVVLQARDFKSFVLSCGIPLQACTLRGAHSPVRRRALPSASPCAWRSGPSVQATGNRKA